jgi:hypothetical protein
MSAELNTVTILQNEINPETYSQTLDICSMLKTEINDKLTEIIKQEKEEATVSSGSEMKKPKTDVGKQE